MDNRISLTNLTIIFHWFYLHKFFKGTKFLTIKYRSIIINRFLFKNNNKEKGKQFGIIYPHMKMSLKSVL